MITRSLLELRQPLQRSQQKHVQLLALLRLPDVEVRRVGQRKAGHEVAMVERDGLLQRSGCVAVGAEPVELGHVDVERRRRDKFHGILARLDMMMADHLVQRGERATQTHAGACLVRVRPEECGKRVAAKHTPGHRQVGKDRERFAAVERCHFAVDIDLRGPQ